jgi:PPOX class probable F420-dependent enzyme
MPARMSKRQRDQFLAGRRIAVLVTIAPDGTPVPTPIWYLWRNGAFFFRTSAEGLKTENIRRDPRVSICVQDERPPYKALVAYGKASIEQSDARLEREIPRHYLGAIGAIGYRAAAQEAIQQGPEITLVVRPDRFTTTDFAAETPIYGRAWLLLKRVLPPWL